MSLSDYKTRYMHSYMNLVSFNYMKNYHSHLSSVRRFFSNDNCFTHFVVKKKKEERETNLGTKWNMIHNLDLHFYCSVEIGLSNARKGGTNYKFHSIIKKKSTLEIPQATLLGSLHNSFKKSAHKTWQ